MGPPSRRHDCGTGGATAVLSPNHEALSTQVPASTRIECKNGVLAEIVCPGQRACFRRLFGSLHTSGISFAHAFDSNAAHVPGSSEAQFLSLIHISEPTRPY